MYLTLYVVLILVSLLIIALGFYREEYSALAISGFFFLFFLSFVIIDGSLEYKIGVNVTNTYECLCCDAQEGTILCPYSENATLVVTGVESVDVYESWTGDGNAGHWFGYILAVMSVIGLIGAFVSVGSERFLK